MATSSKPSAGLLQAAEAVCAYYADNTNMDRLPALNKRLEALRAAIAAEEKRGAEDQEVCCEDYNSCLRPCVARGENAGKAERDQLRKELEAANKADAKWHNLYNDLVSDKGKVLCQLGDMTAQRDRAKAEASGDEKLRELQSWGNQWSKPVGSEGFRRGWLQFKGVLAEKIDRLLSTPPTTESLLTGAQVSSSPEPAAERGEDERLRDYMNTAVEFHLLGDAHHAALFELCDRELAREKARGGEAK